MNERRVIDTQDGLTQLVECHAAALDPRAAVRAAGEVRGRLANGVPPEADALSEGLFALDLDPLRVIFESDDAVHLVKVVAVGLLPGRAGWTRPGAFGPR